MIALRIEALGCLMKLRIHREAAGARRLPIKDALYPIPARKKKVRLKDAL